MKNSNHNTLISLFVIIILAGFSPAVQADIHTWTGNGTSGDWSDANNWDLGVPATGDDVIFGNGDTINLSNVGRTEPRHISIQGNTQVVLIERRIVVRGDLTVSSGTFDINDNELRLTGKAYVNGGTLLMSSATTTMYEGIELTNGTLNIENGKIIFFESDLSYSGGSFIAGTGTLEFQGETSSKITATLDISVYRLIVNMSDWYGLFSLEGNGNTVFTILDYVQINNYDAYYNDPPLALSQAYISYANGSSLKYNRPAGIPATGDEWPASNMPKVIFAEGEITLDEAKSSVDTVIIQNGSLIGNIAYGGDESLLSYDPLYNQNITIGSEWPTTDGPSSLNITNSGYSIIGYDNITLLKNLTITDGTLDLNNKTITVLGSVSGSTISGSGSIANGTSLIVGNQNLTNYAQTISGSVSFSDINIDKSGGASESDNKVSITQSISLKNGSSLTLTNGRLDFNGQSFVLGGNNQLINTGTIYTGGTSLNNFSSIYSPNGNLVFDGTISETIPSGFTVFDLTMNNPEGANTSTGTLTVSGELELIQGQLTTSSSKTVLMDIGSNINQHSSASFINGPLQKVFSASGSFTFPIGNSDISKPVTFSYSYFDGAENSNVELSYFHNSTFSTGTLPDDISESDNTGYFTMKEVGTTPDSMAYSLTMPFSNENFLPENRNRILLQQSDTPTWLVGTTDAATDVDTALNQVTMSGMNTFPTNSGMIILGKGNQLVVFTGFEDLDWFNTNNWSSGSLPTSVDDIVVEENTTLKLGDDDGNSGTETPLQQVATITLSANSVFEIDSTNTATTSLLVGHGVGDDTVLHVNTNSELIINGGANKTIALQNSSNEKMFVEGTVTMTSGRNFGVGTGGLDLPASRQTWTLGSTLNFGIASQYFNAQDYGNLTLNLVDEMILNESMTVHGDLTFNSGTFAFVRGDVTGKHFVIENDLYVKNDAFVRTCLENNGTNVFSIEGDINVDNTASFYSEMGAILELSGDEPQLVCTTVTQLRKLKISGAGVKTLSTDLTVTESLDLDGIINANGNTITIGTDPNNPGSLNIDNDIQPYSKAASGATLTNNGNGKVRGIIGRLLRFIPPWASANIRFPIQSNSFLREVVLHFPEGSGGGLVYVDYNPNPPGANGLPLTDGDGVLLKNIYPGGYWTIHNIWGVSNDSYEVELITNEFTGVSNPSEVRLIKREDETQPWQVLGDHQFGSIDENGQLVVKRVGLQGFSDFTFAGSDSNPLPVELSNFEGFIESAGIPELRWSTATERENYGFHIERSDQPIDISADTSWTEIAFVEGNGTTTEEQSYSYTDNSATLNGTYLYRLIQEDYDGTKTTHDTLDIKVELATHTGLSSVYPNPFNPQTTVAFSVNKTQSVKINLYNVLGQRVRVLANSTFEAGNHSLRLNAQSLSSGTYLLVMQADGRQHVKKISLIE